MAALLPVSIKRKIVKSVRFQTKLLYSLWFRLGGWR